MGNWAVGCGASSEDLAVAFYKNGIELKRYSTRDLIKNSKNASCTVSHYFWQAKDEPFPKLTYRDEFHLKTIEGVEYVFNITNGARVKP